MSPNTATLVMLMVIAMASIATRDRPPEEEETVSYDIFVVLVSLGSYLQCLLRCHKWCLIAKRQKS